MKKTYWNKTVSGNHPLRLAGLWLSILLVSTVLAGSGDFNKGGRTAFQVTKIGIGARQAAMGEACAAAVKDINSMYWNPAGLKGVTRLSASLNYTDWLSDLKYLSLSLAYRFGRHHVLALGLATLDYGDLEEALISEVGGASDTRTGDMFSGGDQILQLCYARDFTDRLTIGFTAKYLSEELFIYIQDLIVFDVGTYYNTGYKGIRIGMSAQNFGVSSVKWLENSDRADGYDIPLIYRVGTALNLVSGSDGFLDLGSAHQLQAAFDALNTNDYGERYHFGLEYSYRDYLFVRGGYRQNYQEGNLTMGIGLHTGKFQVDYSYTGYTYLDSPQRITLLFEF